MKGFSELKSIVREVLIFLHIDATQNLKYDRLTNKILRSQLKSDSNCVDIGCHKGEILKEILKHSPNGTHFAFEPLPELFQSLCNRYGKRAHIYSYALSDTDGGSVEFNHIINAPAYSGLRKRNYDSLDHVEIETIRVEKRTLDQVIDDTRIDLVKIDIEGGDYHALLGARNILQNYHPLLIFEFGKGGADYYGVTAGQMYGYLADELGYGIYTLDAFVRNGNPLGLNEFTEDFETGKEYYFVAKH